MKYVVLILCLAPFAVLGQTSLNPESDSVYTEVTKMPEFPGGIPAFYRYVSHTVRYPNIARRSGIQGTVLLNFIIEKDGTVTNVVVKESVSTEVDAEAMRAVLSSPRWTPGESEGVPVRVRLEHPVKFKLAD